jgi:hypothetical protein
MKTMMKYLSLLIFSGLIIPFYDTAPVCNINPKPILPQTAIYNTIAHKTRVVSFSFYNSVIEKIFPVLKNLN